MRSKQPRLTWLIRTGIVLLFEGIGLLLLTALVPGIHVDSIGAGIALIILVSIVNALLWPILARLTLPLIVFTFGIGALVLNGILVLVAADFIDGVHFDSLWNAVFAAFVLTIINVILSAVLTIDDDAPYYRSALRRQAKRARKGAPIAGYPGVIFLEIDGLSEAVLRKALDGGHMPTLAGWLADGSHRLMGWETDTSCQTGGCQAGILHGNNKHMPAFRWVEKENGNKLMTSTGPTDAPVLEERISDGDGLLSQNGRSRSNLFSGDAEQAMFTYSKLAQVREFYTPYYYIYFSNPYNFMHTIVLTIWDIVLEIRSRRRQQREDVQPRLSKKHRSGLYPVVRAFTTVFLRDLTTYTLMGDIFLAEADAMYSTYVAYDEIAHHSGVEDPDAFDILAKLDREFSRLQRAVEKAPREYKFVVLADHGQSQGNTFKERYGLTLEEHISSLLPNDLNVRSKLDTNEGWSHVSMAATDVSSDDERWSGRAVRRLTRSRSENGVVKIGPDGEREEEATETGAGEPQVVVLASGNLGLVYFNQWSHRMSREELDAAFPALLDGLINHEGVGFVMVRSESDGALVLGANGTYYLDEDRFEGQNPLAVFRPRAAEHLRRTDAFNFVPDILVNSFYDPVKDEGAAFEELVGYHGGLGGNQAFPFLLFPADWDLDREELVGAEQVYHALKRQLARVQKIVPPAQATVET